MLIAQNLTHRYRDELAVDGLDMRIDAGEILGLAGPNGAGKTTTLRILAGILSPLQGTISIGGHDLAHDPVSAKRVTGYVPDNPHLFGALTVKEHLLLTASIYRIGDSADRAEALLEQFALIPHRDKPAHTLSLGMRQKVSVCCAYIVSPLLLIFDEPLVGLDPSSMRTLKQSIRQKARAGAAVVVSSHLMTVLEELCDSVLVIDKGREVLSGPLDVVMSQARELDADADLEKVFLDVAGA